MQTLLIIVLLGSISLNAYYFINRENTIFAKDDDYRRKQDSANKILDSISLVYKKIDDRLAKYDSSLKSINEQRIKDRKDWKNEIDKIKRFRNNGDRSSYTDSVLRANGYRR